MRNTRNSSNGFDTRMKPKMIRYPQQLGKPWHGGCQKGMIEIPEVYPLDKLAADMSTALRIT